MSVVIQKKDLLDAVQKAFPVVPSKGSLLILSNFKLSYSDSILEIVATDADHSLRVTVGASGEGPFDITVNARRFFDAVRVFPEGAITLSLDGMVMLMESASQKGFHKEAGADSSDFPGVPEIKDGVELSINGFVLREIIQKTSFAASKDETRPVLCGILWELSSDKTGMVATDGSRLGHSFVDINLPVEESLSKIVSRKSVETLMRITDSKDKDESLKVVIGERYISFSTPSFAMVSKLIEGQYPEYDRVIPKNNPKKIVADRVAMLETIGRAAILSSQKDRLVKLIFRTGDMEATVKNIETGGETKWNMPVEYSGEEHIMGFNGQFFMEILDTIKTEKVRFEVNTQISACLIFPEYADEKDKNSEDLFLLMPLRIG
ncbi:MAG: DNA polymerase III subunit beta [Chitinispirillales bacterium]|jgi:DNA polymerase-3 subunit beta|nr:DNA polymerase III subunit beta [Chitinispirillales bacterium]